MVKLKMKRRNPSITTSSMSDIGFLLLIFIMLISLMNQRYEEKINYSESTVLERTQADSNFEIWVQKNGIISADGNELDSISLEKAWALYRTGCREKVMKELDNCDIIIADLKCEVPPLFIKEHQELMAEMSRFIEEN